MADHVQDKELEEKELTDEALDEKGKPLPFHQHPRWKERGEKLRAAKSSLERYESLGDADSIREKLAKLDTYERILSQNDQGGEEEQPPPKKETVPEDEQNERYRKALYKLDPELETAKRKVPTLEQEVKELKETVGVVAAVFQDINTTYLEELMEEEGLLTKSMGKEERGRLLDRTMAILEEDIKKNPRDYRAAQVAHLPVIKKYLKGYLEDTRKTSSVKKSAEEEAARRKTEGLPKRIPGGGIPGIGPGAEPPKNLKEAGERLKAMLKAAKEG